VRPGANPEGDQQLQQGERPPALGQPELGQPERGEPDLDRAGAELIRLRSSIDNLDAALVHVLAERFKCTQAVGLLKAAHGMPPADLDREAQQIARLRRLAAEARLDPEFAEKFLTFIIAEVVRHHEAIADT
jgi:chorismate mutase